MKKTNTILNLGPVSSEWLTAVGIHDLEDLKAAGVINVYLQVKQKGFPATLNLLYGLEGAVRGIPWRAVDTKTKEALKRQVAKALHS